MAALNEAVFEVTRLYGDVAAQYALATFVTNRERVPSLPDFEAKTYRSYSDKRLREMITAAETIEGKTQVAGTLFTATPALPVSATSNATPPNRVTACTWSET